ncbi:MAG: DUF177 domain-containing protein [Eggerthellaceae bacterium]|nr:DUF177 domain-containing protein [Eggerthellaceae bacterium]
MPSACIKISNELFATAESSSFMGEHSLASLKAGPDLYEFEDELAWEVKLTNTGDAFLLVGRVGGRAKTACARCLEEFALELEGEIEAYYLLSEQSIPPDDMDEDEYEVLPKDNVIDLSTAIKAALLLELPLVPLCKLECKGLCLSCGADLNTAPCECRRETEAEGVGKKESPFSVLKGFPFKDKA